MSAPLRVAIDDEIGPLRAVMVHRPGDELVHMTQHELRELLFDDILSAPAAVREHDLMTELFRGAGAQVLDVLDLLVAALARAPVDARQRLLADICEERGVLELAGPLHDFEADALADALVGGLRWEDVDSPTTLARLAQPGDQPLPPCPNLMFMRDPCIGFRDRVVAGRMSTPARLIESWLVAFAIEHSGRFAPGTLLFQGHDRDRAPQYRALEGGDVLVLSPEALMIGCSERTSAQTIERVAREQLFPAFADLRRVHVVLMPRARTVMHLDTICTQIDRQLFLAFTPQICPGPHALPVAVLERDGGVALATSATVRDTLHDELGPETVVVPCGGADPVQQQREQWTDGANAFCVAPGKIVLYARNALTIAALAEHGFVETALHWVQTPAERGERIAAGLARARTVFSVPAGELSRARGGGRCLTMPLVREPK